MQHKGHLGFAKDKYSKTLSWSLEKHEVTRRKVMRFANKERFMVNTKWHDRYELMKIPPTTDEFVVPKRVKLKTKSGKKVLIQPSLFGMLGKKSPKKRRKKGKYIKK